MHKWRILVTILHHSVKVNTGGLGHTKDGALLGKDTGQTPECRQGRQSFPHTFLPLHFPMLRAQALTQRHYH